MPPLTTEGCLQGRDGDKDRDTHPGQRGSFGDAGSSAVLPVPACPGQGCPLPAEWATQAAIAGAASQAAGAEVVVAVEQAGVLVGLVAEQAHQWVAVCLLQLRAAPQWGENAARHLWG